MTQVSVDRIQGLSGSLAIKRPVACATTANVTLNGLQTIDGFVLASGDRVLVKNQTTGSENGVYEADTSDWRRTLDFNGTGDIVEGTLVNVIGGSTNYGLWILSTANPVVGTSSLAFGRPVGYTGAEAINYLPAGTGAVATTVQGKLHQFPQADDYSTNAAYMAAVEANETSGWYASEGVKITRFPDRVFIGEAGARYAGGPSPDAGASWLDSAADGPHYLLSNATLLAMPSQRRYGIVGAVSTGHSTVGAGSVIGIGSVTINDATGVDAVPAWAFITEVQHETPDAKTWGIELAVKNASGAGTTITPFSASPTNMTTGLLLSGGGDNAFGPASTNPCTAGIIFSTNNSMGWNSGIVFRAASIPTGEAIALPQSYDINWYENTDAVSGSLTCTNNTPDTKMTLSLGSNALSVLNNAGNSAFFVSTTATAVNRIQVTANNAGAAPSITAAGSDTDVDLHLIASGAGKIRFGTWTSNADAAVNGYVTIKDSAGTTRKLATIA